MSGAGEFRTPLARARGLGSAKTGTGDFIAQRVSAVALIALVAWALLSAFALARGDYASASAWLRSPLNAALSVLTAVAVFIHMHVGMRVIIEDYAQAKAARVALLIGNLFLCVAGAVVSILCLLKVALSAGGGI